MFLTAINTLLLAILGFQQEPAPGMKVPDPGVFPVVGYFHQADIDGENMALAAFGGEVIFGNQDAGFKKATLPGLTTPLVAIRKDLLVMVDVRLLYVSRDFGLSWEVKPIRSGFGQAKWVQIEGDLLHIVYGNGSYRRVDLEGQDIVSTPPLRETHRIVFQHATHQGDKIFLFTKNAQTYVTKGKRWRRFAKFIKNAEGMIGNSKKFPFILNQTGLSFKKSFWGWRLQDTLEAPKPGWEWVMGQDGSGALGYSGEKELPNGGTKKTFELAPVYFDGTDLVVEETIVSPTFPRALAFNRKDGAVFIVASGFRANEVGGYNGKTKQWFPIRFSFQDLELKNELPQNQPKLEILSGK